MVMVNLVKIQLVVRNSELSSTSVVLKVLQINKILSGGIILIEALIWTLLTNIHLKGQLKKEVNANYG